MSSLLTQLYEVDGTSVRYMFSVDTGNICVVDLKTIFQNGGKIGESAKRNCKIIKIDPGTYNVKVFLPQTHLGKIRKDNIVKFPSGKIAIGDICYFFEKDDGVKESAWEDFLDKTNFLDKIPDGISVGTGGDGKFYGEVTFTN